MLIDPKLGFRFGSFTAEPLKGCVTGDDMTPRHLPPKAMDVLVSLAKSAPEPVTRRDLIDEVWGERYVSDEVLTHAIKELRHALGDLPSNPQYIQTIPKRGYQLLKTAYPITDSLPDKAFAAIQRNVRVAVLVVAVALVIVVAIQMRKIEPEPVVTENSIAVLPFGVCEQAHQEPLVATGIFEEVINRLSERGSLKVIARSSIMALAGYGLPIPEIAKPLGVQYVLQGTLCHTGTAPMLTAELANAQGFIVWSDTFVQEVDEFDTVTARLASQVANGVAAKFGDATDYQRETPVNSRAYEQLLIGRQFAEQRNWNEARAAVDRALQIEADFAEAIFTSTLLELWDRQREGADATQVLRETNTRLEQALALAEERIERGERSFEAYYVAGRILQAISSWEKELIWRQSAEMDEDEIAHRNRIRIKYLVRAENHFRAAIDINASNTDSYTQLFDVVEEQSLERRAEALEILQRGRRRDPFNVDYNSRLAFRVAARGRYREAIEILERFNALPEVPKGIWSARTEVEKNMFRFDDMGQTLVKMLSVDPAAIEIEPGGPINGGVNFNNRLQFLEFLNRLWALGLEEHAEQWYLRVKDLPGVFWLGELMLESYLIETGRGESILEAKREKFAAMTDEDLMSDRWFLRATTHAGDLAILGQYERAIRLVEALQYHDYGGPQWAERAMLHKHFLATLYRQVGRYSDSAALLVDVAEYLELEYETGIRHPQTLGLLAGTYVRLGRDDEALAMLKIAVDYGWNGDVLWERSKTYDWLASTWTSLRKDARFLREQERMRADLNRQAEHISALLAQYDIDELLAPLMALPASSVEYD